MLRRRSTNHSIAWFADQRRAKNLDLNPPYQRGDLVWSRDYKDYFIDTILRNFPSPAIFLHVETSPDGHTIYHVVDGKQRLTAIFEFIEGIAVLSPKYSKGDYTAKEFNDLSDTEKQAFWEYEIPVQEVLGASEDDLRNAFDRLNRNVSKLAKQELRNAAFSGEFVKQIENLTKEPFWEDIGISNRTTAKRMKDEEFVAEIFLLTMHGILNGTDTKIIDGYYQNYDIDIPNRDVHIRHYRACIRIIEDLGLQKIRESRFSNLSDFYSLWAAILKLTDRATKIDPATTIQALLKFDKEFAQYIDSPENFSTRVDLIEYYDNVRQGVNKLSNRQKRTDIIEKLIKIKS